MTKGGLQDITSSAPPLSLRPTCSNAIFNNSESSVYINSPSPEEQLPDLSLPLNATSSSSNYVSDSALSLDLDFENSKFETFELIPSVSLPLHFQSNFSQFFSMESDCKDEVKTFTSNSSASSSNDEILKILTAISSQMVVGHQDLQSQLISHNLHLREELQKVKEENEKFCQEIHAELSSTTSSQPVVSSSVIPTVSTSVPIVNQVLPTGGTSSSYNSADFQQQMLTVLNDTLSTVISDTSSILQDTKSAISESKSSEAKTEWTKFSGDPKKFRQWYLSIMAQSSIAPWQPLYDPTTNSVVTATVNSALNGKLYAKVIGALEGSA
jgi:hypothetical protein